MTRGDWLLNLARILCVEPGHIAVIAREARRQGLVTTGARGRNSLPWTPEEKRAILECFVIAACDGSVCTSYAEYRCHLRYVEWKEDGLWATRKGSATVSAHLPQKFIDAAMKA